MSRKQGSPKQKLPSETLLRSFASKTPALISWESRLDADLQRKLRQRKVRSQHSRWVYLDSFYRLRQTTPLILSMVRRLNPDPGEEDAVRFWSEHLLEEVNHDKVMLSDLEELFGGSAQLKEEMRKNPITPPSAALLGYFHWQVEFGNPHYLMLLRFYLEWYASHHEQRLKEFSENLENRGTQTIALHAELDPHHSKDCGQYVDRHLRGVAPEVLTWHTDFIIEQLIGGQIWIANRAG